MSTNVSVKINIIYNVLLTISTYVAALIVYPYASRVLGVENIGIVGFILKTIDGFVLFTTLGVTVVGIRETAAAKADQQRLSQVFSSLVTILIVSTLIVTIAYFVSILFIPSLHEHYRLFVIGLSKLIASAFLIEWFYQGIENFRYMTLRNLALKVLYIISVFIFVRTKSDYEVYLLLNVLVIVLNAIINWGTSRKYTHFKFTLKGAKVFLVPVMIYGAYQVLNAVYSTFNYTFLGSYCSKVEVGYYYTAEQFYTVLLSIITAVTKVLMPRTSSYLSDKNYEAFNKLIEKSFSGILSICIPIAIIGSFYASDILNMLVGPEYDGAILPMQIMMILVLVNGINQIFILQVAMTLKLDKEILIGTLVASILALSLNKYLLINLGAVGASLVLVVSVIVANIYPIVTIVKRKLIRIPVLIILKKVINGLPYIVICIAVSLFTIDNQYIKLGILAILSGSYFFFVNRNEIVEFKR